ncbi:hypothetical protein ABT297_01505 [Dactylosporangium sp. NPDC000555]|uniref:hypothetical protein n=1 Tax=Dactylosporangium sp. NPDC000555 TaxID=3154260 RepID=UPI00331C9EDD
MRDLTLGRWIVRLAVIIGAGSAALGLSTAAAHAGVISNDRVIATRIVSVADALNTGVSQVTSPPSGIFVTEDYGWS